MDLISCWSERSAESSCDSLLGDRGTPPVFYCASLSSYIFLERLAHWHRQALSLSKHLEAYESILKEWPDKAPDKARFLLFVSLTRSDDDSHDISCDLLPRWLVCTTGLLVHVTEEQMSESSATHRLMQGWDGPALLDIIYRGFPGHILDDNCSLTTFKDWIVYWTGKFKYGLRYLSNKRMFYSLIYWYIYLFVYLIIYLLNG